MRQIKFRAWDKKVNKFDERFPRELKYFGELGFTLTSNDFEFSQFTGLLDKNGKEIYEGDEMWDGQRHGQIKWNDANCKFILEGDDFTFEMIDLKDKNFSVGGNIYENPELLK